MKNTNVYFIGIGGIGMSALARHFNAQGSHVAGYDRTATRLTDEIIAEGIEISFEDDINTVPEEFKNQETTTVVVTPAIPQSNKILTYFSSNGFDVVKRSTMLGYLTQDSDAICIAGSHGKTTTSTLTAHILKNSQVGCSAFLGGISANYNTNYWSNTKSSFIVTEADEFDRSFLKLHPYLSLITSMDADHLDVYGTADEVKKAFRQFARQTVVGGSIVYKFGLNIGEAAEDQASETEEFTYSLDNDEADFYAFDIKLDGGLYKFSVKTPFGIVRDLKLGLPGMHNVENAVAAISLAMLAGAEANEVREALATFRGNRRRFQYRINERNFCLIDDYAHHPEEIRTMLTSLRKMYGERKITAVFQPHLFTRTRDFADDFASALSLADRILLLEIYPAREEPIEGINSSMLINKMSNRNVKLINKENLINEIEAEPLDVIVMMGAGDIDKLVPIVEERIKATKNIQ